MYVLLVIRPKNWIGYEKTKGITDASSIMTQLLTRACLIQKLRLPSRYYSIMLDNEVYLTKLVILKITALFIEIVFLMYLHIAPNLATSDPDSALLCFICGMTIIACLIQKFRLPSRYHPNLLNTEVYLTKLVI